MLPYIPVIPCLPTHMHFNVKRYLRYHYLKSALSGVIILFVVYYELVNHIIVKLIDENSVKSGQINEYIG